MRKAIKTTYGLEVNKTTPVQNITKCETFRVICLGYTLNSRLDILLKYVCKFSPQLESRCIIIYRPSLLTIRQKQ